MPLPSLRLESLAEPLKGRSYALYYSQYLVAGIRAPSVALLHRVFGSHVPSAARRSGAHVLDELHRPGRAQREA
eukprot:scaffold40561_cov72-Phaeocystis_antarctica.AAC.10